jgi:hypothetical protein
MQLHCVILIKDKFHCLCCTTPQLSGNFYSKQKQVSYEHGSLMAMKFSQGNTTSHIYIYIYNIFAIL